MPNSPYSREAIAAASCCDLSRMQALVAIDAPTDVDAVDRVYTVWNQAAGETCTAEEMRGMKVYEALRVFACGCPRANRSRISGYITMARLRASASVKSEEDR